ncbi:MAG: hypothetical protein E6K78_04070 [Candidatus Eisenbacteria bacterium]|uniref:Tetratricopeptide repeat protein n=1 Tax=Eiseniibacteriota bacterium TaxID=2212470 RepID=A0A538TVM5_UNCEI|nr:MAG: hypothetical protein E6K78_04070 [Candidatus Eisenbacteria bacterium]
MRVDALLRQSTSAADLRARLLAHAASLPDSAHREQGEALYFVGLSFERDGKADSAITAYERACELRGEPTDRDALVDALLQRDASGDAARALARLRGPVVPVLLSTQWDAQNFDARQAWALYLAGRADSALDLLHSIDEDLYQDDNPLARDWRYRAAVMELEHGDAKRAVAYLEPLAVASREADRDVMGMLKEAGRKLGVQPRLHETLRRRLMEGERDDKALLTRLGMRRLSFTAEDGAVLGAILLAPATAHRALVVLLDSGESVEAYDSLASGLGRAGYALVFLEPRGSGGSVGPACPLPETWRGREARMQLRVAEDVVHALRTLAKATSVDTASYGIVAAPTMGSSAIDAARVDHRVRRLVLLSPTPSPVDLGRMGATLARLKLPVFFQTVEQDAESAENADALLASAQSRASRVADSPLGHGAQAFHYDASALPRLLRWLDESWPARR